MKSAYPPFNPVISDRPDGLTYEDGRVFGAIETGTLENGQSFLRIDEWSSHFPSQGHTNEALRWLRTRYDVITANGVGTVEEGVGDISTLYWEHQRQKGLVDTLILDDRTILQPEDHLWKESPQVTLKSGKNKP